MQVIRKFSLWLKNDSFEKKGNKADERHSGFFSGLKNKLKTIFKGNDKCVENFKKTPEGIRRASMSSEEFEKNMHCLFNNICDELGIAEKNRPKLRIFSLGLYGGRIGGGYTSLFHSLFLNSLSYKNGLFIPEHVMMHELIHCDEAIKRAGIPKERVDEVIKNALISKIYNNETEKVPGLGLKFVTPPRMPDEMQKDFAEFAQENLYKKSFGSFLKILFLLDYVKGKAGNKAKTEQEAQIEEKFHKYILGDNILQIDNKLKAMIKKYPEFVNQYKNEEEALFALLQYSALHSERYFVTPKIGIPRIEVEQLSGEKLDEAEKSLMDDIATAEGNARLHSDKDFLSAYRQYEFSPEEALAEIKSAKFVIKSFSKKYETMKSQGTLTQEQELFIKLQIKKARLNLEYKQKGLDFYQMYTRCLYDGKNVKEIIEKLIELEELRKEMHKCDDEYIKTYSCNKNLH